MIEEAIMHHYGAGVDFEVKKGVLVWKDSRPMPSDSEISTWYDDYLASESQSDLNNSAREFLSETDWVVIRHRDQLDIGGQTSLTDDEYRSLLLERQQKRESVTGET